MVRITLKRLASPAIIGFAVLFCCAVIIASNMFPSNARTFYCAGRAVAEHQNPYLVEPLRSCEHAINPVPGFELNEVEPAPLPPYAFPGLELWSLLPYSTAHLAWCALLIGSLVIATLAMAKITAFPAAYILLAFSFVDGFLNVAFGDIAPICVALLCVSALCVMRKRLWPAVACASLAMIEPHVALPACVALCLFVPAARARLLLCAIVLLVLGIGTLGWSENLNYFRFVLPAHALSEVRAPDQYSLTWLLSRFGVSSERALRLGSASYACMLITGAVLAQKLALRYRDNAFLVLLPPCAALLGGTFVHDLQFAAAIPAGILLAARSRCTSRLLWSIILLFAFPLNAGGSHFSGIFFGCAAGGGVALLASRQSPLLSRIALCIAVIGLVIAFDTLEKAAQSHEPQTPLHLSAGRGDELASLQWGRYINASSSENVWSFSEAVKIPVWLAFAGFLVVSSTRLRSSENGEAGGRVDGGVALRRVTSIF